MLIVISAFGEKFDLTANHDGNEVAVTDQRRFQVIDVRRDDRVLHRAYDVAGDEVDRFEIHE